MNENNNLNNNNNNVDNTQTYKAMGNLNTAISNPSANINNTMSVNIASSGEAVTPKENIPAENKKVVAPTTEENVTPTNNTEVNRTFVTDNKPKKRTISLNLGKEFKIALFIIVVLLIFIFLLPLLPNFF